MLAHKKLWESGLNPQYNESGTPSESCWWYSSTTTEEEFALMSDNGQTGEDELERMFALFFALYFADEASDPISRMQVNSDYDPEDYIEV